MRLFVRGKLDTFLLCLALGGAYRFISSCTMTALLLTLPAGRATVSPLSFTLLVRLPCSVLTGMLTGAVWALFAVPMLRRKPLKPVIGALVPLVAVLSIAMVFIGVSGRLGHATAPWVTHLAPAAAVLLACAALKRALPDEPAWTCSECGQRLDARGVCVACGDAAMYRRRSAQYRVLALLGLSVFAAMIVLFFATRDSSCGYWGDGWCIGIGQGTLFWAGDLLTFEGWFWSECRFYPVSGYVWWPVIAGRIIAIPLWIVSTMIAIPSWRTLQLARRAVPGRCRKCGYDLTGNTSGVCPECGTPAV